MRASSQDAEWPAEYLLKASDGVNFGWPYCFYNNAEGHLVTNPEYGGDGKQTDRCASFTQPTGARSALWASASSSSTRSTPHSTKLFACPKPARW